MLLKLKTQTSIGIIQRYADDLAKLQNEHGVNVHRTPDSVMQAQLEAWDIVLTEFQVKMLSLQKLIESQKVYAEKCYGLPEFEST